MTTAYCTPLKCAREDRMKWKKTLASLVLVALLSAALTYAITLKTMQNNMHVSGISAVAIEKPQGTRIEAYDWGQFNNIGNAKTETFWLKNIGNGPLNVNGTVTGLPSGWTVSLSKSDWSLQLNETVAFNMTVTLLEALPQGAYSFSLVFSMP
jgi:hypothetical protein